VWYEGSGTSDRRFLQADERGSIIAVTDSGGSMLGVNSYDEYGYPWGLNNIGRFQYTGQAWYGEGPLQLQGPLVLALSAASCRPIPSVMVMASTGITITLTDPVNGSDPRGEN
jgi:hypothetical protein